MRSDEFVRLVALDLFNGQALDERAWEELRPGVQVSWLYQIPDGPSAALLRYSPGARVPRHRHTGMEHIVVLSGAQSDANGSYPAGTCLVHAAGTSHEVHSAHGCVALAIWERPVEFE